MRTTLFLSTLFVTTLVAGAALAEGPQGSRAKAPSAIDRIRSHGDMVDKTYRGATKATPGAEQASQAVNVARQAKAHGDKSSSRVNCSDTGADCGSSRSVKSGGDQSSALQTSAGAGDREARMPAFLDKVLGSDRTNINEAGVDQGMSNRAAQRAWSRAGAARVDAGDTAGAARGEATTVGQSKRAEQAMKLDKQAGSERMVCNEADECMMSSKAAKKVWANDQIQKGMWNPKPEAKGQTPAEAAVARMKKEQTEKK